MYNWAIAFIVMSLAAAVFALGGFGAPYDQLGALLSPLFLALSVVSAVMGKRTRHRQQRPVDGISGHDTPDIAAVAPRAAATGQPLLPQPPSRHEG